MVSKGIDQAPPDFEKIVTNGSLTFCSDLYSIHICFYNHFFQNENGTKVHFSYFRFLNFESKLGKM